jgi:hypothetical protein
MTIEELNENNLKKKKNLPFHPSSPIMANKEENKRKKPFKSHIASPPPSSFIPHNDQYI